MLAPLRQEDCFANVPQDFLICTTVHKARQLGVFQGEVYVRLTLDKMSRHTKAFANSENPYFNEYFVFEIRCTLRELLRLTIVYEVKKRAACKRDLTLGELLVDMQSVWNQGNRCYFKRWGHLQRAIEEEWSHVSQGRGLTEAKGFLQIDLAIVSQASKTHTLLRPDEDDLMSMNVWQMHHDYDDIEKNLLESSYFDLKCNIRYSVTFYRAVMSKKCDYMLQFRFHPFKAKTNVIKSTQYPVWNQEITFAWTYPSLSQTFLIQLMAHEHFQWKCVVEHEIHLDDIALKDRPRLGPCFIHFYDDANPSRYVGRLLLEIKSECLESNLQRQIHVKHVAHLEEKRHWDDETFVAEFVALQGDFVHANFTNCKINMKLAEHTSDNLECFLKPYPAKKGHSIANNLKYITNEPPYKAITLRSQLPDERRKYQVDIFARAFLLYIKRELETFRQFRMMYSTERRSQIKVLKNILTLTGDRIRMAFETEALEYRGLKEPAKSDADHFQKLKQIFVNFSDDLKMLRSRLKAHSDIVAMESVLDEILGHLCQFINKLENLFAIQQQTWPDLILLLNSANKEVGICRLNVKDFIFLPSVYEDVANGGDCWKVRNFVFQDLKCQHTCNTCGCSIAHVVGSLCIVAEKEWKGFVATIKPDWRSPEPFYWSPTLDFTSFKCRIFLHQAKIRPGADRDGLCDPYAKVTFGSNASETPILYATLSPLWNCVITFDNIKLPGYIQWYRENPPLVAVELYDADKNAADEYLGCAAAKVTVISSDWMDGGRRENTSLLNSKHAIQKFQAMQYRSPPPLTWQAIACNGCIRAEVLMSAELVEAELSGGGTADAEATIVATGIPASIRPTMKNFVVEVIFAGFRNYKRLSLFSSRHRVKIMLADLLLSSGLSSVRIGNSINFLVLYASGVVSLPEQLEYWPAVIATDVAVSSRGQETTLGAVLISNTKRYLQENKQSLCLKVNSAAESDPDTSDPSTMLCTNEQTENETSPLLKERTKSSFWKRFTIRTHKQQLISHTDSLDLMDAINDSEYNWWTKFYNSGIVESCGALSPFKHKLCIYSNELEKQPEFDHFTDWAEPLQMVHGVRNKRNNLTKENAYTTLKLKIKITACQCENTNAVDGTMLKPLPTALSPRFQTQLQELANLVKIVVRVYIVQGLHFRPSAKTAQADAYVRLQLGHKTVSNRAEYAANERNPVFGRCFQLDCLLPKDHSLELSVFNRCHLQDESIGCTSIDLEDRWRTKHRATVGIANEYCSYGYNKWRDTQSPTQILHELCLTHGIKPPRMSETTIEVDGVTLEDETDIATDEDLQERLSLSALKNMQHFPSFGYKLVPEHVETRSLYRSDYPGIEQGKIQLWLELYDGNVNLSPPIDITPQPPENYELRVVIVAVSEVVLQEQNIFGRAMSDIYVKGWCSNPDEAQCTDIHYRSLNGEGKFNWRMKFPLKYSSVEDMMVAKRRTGLLEEFHTKEPPKLSLQIWDNDLISQDDFLGSLEMHLSNFPQPSETAKKCHLIDYDSLLQSIALQKGKNATNPKRPVSTTKFLNIFRQKNVRGWFPVRGNIPGKGYEVGLAGKIELELELLTEEEAMLHPVGLARNPPHALIEPVRPHTSFNPFTHPWRGFKQIVAPKMMKYLLIAALLALLGFSIFMLVVHFPVILAFLGH